MGVGVWAGLRPVAHQKSYLTRFTHVPGAWALPSRVAPPRSPGRPNPNGFGDSGSLRVGYALGNVLPYVRAGGVYAGGIADEYSDLYGDGRRIT